jgi:predicted DCC family thiol-disulfide oxidoreductase YuxK
VSNAELSKPSNGALLIFDGDCAFCTTSVNLLKRVLPTFPTATPWQWLAVDQHGLEQGLEQYGLSRDDVARYAWVVTSRHQYAGHLALSALLRMQPAAGWRFLGHLIATPPFLLAAAAGYHVIARNRHRLPGGTPACALPRTG